MTTPALTLSPPTDTILSNVVGLTDAEATTLLHQHGPNAVEEQRPHPLRRFLAELWGSVPWMLEASIVIELALGKFADALITLALLMVNAILSFAQETRAQNALALFRHQGILVA